MNDIQFISKITNDIHTILDPGLWESYEQTDHICSQEQMDGIIKSVINGYITLLKELNILLNSSNPVLEVFIDSLSIKYIIFKQGDDFYISDNYGTYFESIKLHDLIESIIADVGDLPIHPITEINKLIDDDKQNIYKLI